MMVVQELKARDWLGNRELCESISQHVLKDDSSLEQWQRSFLFERLCNKKNPYWSEDNPRVINEILLHSEQVTKWNAVGISYFHEESGVAVTETFTYSKTFKGYNENTWSLKNSVSSVIMMELLHT